MCDVTRLMDRGAWFDAVTAWAGFDAASRPGRLICVIDDPTGLKSVLSAAEGLGIKVFPVSDCAWIFAYGTPAIITGTHDEIFSRALNLECGVRPYMRSAQFGLLNCDCVWVDGTGSRLHAALSGLRERLSAFRAVSFTPYHEPDGTCDIPIRRLFAGGDTDVPGLTVRPRADRAGARSGKMSVSGTEWVALPEHSSAVERLVCDMCPDGLPDTGQLRTAARYHDWGKAHPEFQEWLLQGIPPDEYAKRRNVIWAKRRPRADLGRLAYRHDAAGACALLQCRPDEHLAAYLIMTHHYRFRSGMPGITGRLPGTDLGGRIVTDDVSFAMTSDRWGEILDGVYRRYGPFLLAYYEAILRISDMLASDA